MSTTQTPAFAVRNLSVLHYAQGFTGWHYKAGLATVADVLAPRFFQPAEDMLAPGDHIAISASDGGAVLYVDGTKDGVQVRVMCRTP